MSPFQVVVLALGVLALYSSIRDINPLDLVKNTLQGKPTPEAGSWSPEQSGSPVYDPSLSNIGSGLDLGINVGKGMWPTRSHDISARYKETGPRWETYHTGVDIDGECGDRIWASSAGTVAYAGYNGPYGLQVKINISPNTQIWYNHFMGIGAKIRVGQQIAPGEHLGRMGETGNTSGCHLHFEVRVDGEDVDPMPYLSGG